MRFSCIVVCILILLSTEIRADEIKTLQTHVNYLCSNKLEGRLTGTRGEKLAADYIKTEFQHYGLEPAGENGSYYQRFKFNPNKSYGRNVIGRLRLTPHANKILIIGAHLDHLGHGELNDSRATDNESGLVHPGADDNASGVATLLALAARLSEMKRQGVLHGEEDILFAAWSGEEYGILGSSHFVKHTPHAVKAAINLDMVGHLSNDLIIQGTGSSKVWSEIIKQLRAKKSIRIISQEDPYLPTDATAFYLEDIPAINLFTGAHDRYHSPRDTAETLNYVGLKKITTLLVSLVNMIEARKDPIKFQEVKKQFDHSGPQLKIYLGTIPDYSSTIRGVRIAGVAKDSPAKQAGLSKGDVIVALADKEIKNIYDYTNALNALPVNRPAKLVVLRNHKRQILRVIAQSR